MNEIERFEVVSDPASIAVVPPEFVCEVAERASAEAHVPLTGRTPIRRNGELFG